MVARATAALVLAAAMARAIALAHGGVAAADAPPLMTAAADKGSGLTKYEFRLTFTSTPTKSVNHAVARSQVATTTLEADGVSYKLDESAAGDSARWVSWTIAQKGDSWSEAGNITFGAPGSTSSINFESFGFSGSINSGPTPGYQFGAITYNITGGDGMFSDAYGVMVDMFESGATSTTFPIRAWGFFWA